MKYTKDEVMQYVSEEDVKFIVDLVVAVTPRMVPWRCSAVNYTFNPELD